MKNYLKLLLFALSVCIIALPTHAKRQHHERWYQDKHCKGIVEYRLPDATRVDCMVGGYAVEYDFASKWAESIGQSIYYATVTGRKPGVVLIVESPRDCRHILKIRLAIKSYWIPIDIQLISPSGENGIKTISCKVD